MRVSYFLLFLFFSLRICRLFRGQGRTLTSFRQSSAAEMQNQLVEGVWLLLFLLFLLFLLLPSFLEGWDEGWRMVLLGSPLVSPHNLAGLECSLFQNQAQGVHFFSF